jgi:hypothetical protein
MLLNKGSNIVELVKFDTAQKKKPPTLTGGSFFFILTLTADRLLALRHYGELMSSRSRPMG